MNLLNSSEVAALLRISPATVRRLIRLGHLKAARVGRAYRFDPAVVTAFIQRSAI